MSQKFKYKLTSKDFIEAAQIETINHRYFKLHFVYIITFVVLSIISLWQLLHQLKSFSDFSNLDDNELFNLFIYMSGALYFITEYLPKTSPWARNRINRDYKKYFVKQEVKAMEFNEEGISINSDNYREFRQWQDYNKFVENKIMFLLYYSKKECKVIPKRIFNTETELNQFRSLLNQKISLSTHLAK